jgi:hypothetical protein
MESQVYSGLYESYQKIYNEGKADKLQTKPIDRSDARTERAGGNEPSRMLKHFITRNVKKKKGLKEELDIVIEYLLDEGFTDSEEGAEIIASSMSEKWYENILEATDSNKDKNVSQLSTQLSSLRAKQREYQNRLTSNPNDTTAQNALKQIIQQIKNASGARSSLASIQGVSSSNISTPKSKASPEEKMSPEERAAFRSTSLRSTQKTPEERERLQASIRAGAEKAKKARYGSTPQTPSSGERARPTGETRAQSRASRMGDELVGGMAPTYYNRETGKREPIKAVGSTEQNYGGRGSKRVTARYQQGATGSGTQGPTPAGSTIDPTRRRLRGIGRSIG